MKSIFMPIPIKVPRGMPRVKQAMKQPKAGIKSLSKSKKYKFLKLDLFCFKNA